MPEVAKKQFVPDGKHQYARDGKGKMHMIMLLGDTTPKVRRSVRETFEFYLRVRDESEMCLACPWGPHLYPAQGGATALASFAGWEAKGNIWPTSEASLLERGLHAKAYVNLHIKMWAVGCADMLFDIKEFKADFAWYPEWVWKAVEAQWLRLWKAGRRPIGWSWPHFLR